MLGQSVSNRIFIYEVEGLRQNEQTENNRYPVRTSSTILLQVPHSRMNQEMRRIGRLGGKIVNIRPLAEPKPTTQS
jgi:hypothetical protein